MFVSTIAALRSEDSISIGSHTKQPNTKQYNQICSRHAVWGENCTMTFYKSPPHRCLADLGKIFMCQSDKLFLFFMALAFIDAKSMFRSCWYGLVTFTCSTINEKKTKNRWSTCHSFSFVSFFHVLIVQYFCLLCTFYISQFCVRAKRYASVYIYRTYLRLRRNTMNFKDNENISARIVSKSNIHSFVQHCKWKESCHVF